MSDEPTDLSPEAPTHPSPAAVTGIDQPGEGMQWMAYAIWMIAAGLLMWALFSPTTVRISETDALLTRLDPAAHPPPSAVNNIGLMQTKLTLFLLAGFTSLIGTALFCAGAVVRALGRR